MSLTFTDIFCGAGGSSVGLTGAGLTLSLAANHWDRAIETHAANFTDADHLCADVSNYDMRRLPRTDILWASPECTWHSPAGGRKRVRAQLDLFDEHVATDGGIRSRATAFDVVRAVEVHQYRAVIVENVVEFADWPMFDWWLAGLQQLGYNTQLVCVSSAHVGDGDRNPHAPQWRDRLYVVATRKGIRLPDVAPRPPAWCAACGEDVAAVQSWKRADRRPVGKYGQQYVYRCPNGARCRHAIVEPYVLPAASAIDWTDLGTRIGDRTRPLAAATMRRIRAGLQMFAQPAVVAHHGQTWERPGSDYVRAWPAGEAPLNARTGTPGDGVAVPDGFTVPAGGTWRTQPSPLHDPLGARTTRDTDGVVVPPFMVERRDYSGADGPRVRGVDGPMATVTAAGRTVHTLVTPPGAESFGVTLRRNAEPVDLGHDALSTVSTARHHGVVSAPFVDVARTHNRPRGVDEPLAPLTTGRNHGLAVPGSFIQKHHGGLDYARIEHMTKDVADPLPAVVARPNLSLVIPYRRGNRARPAGTDPLPTLSTRESAALATGEQHDIDVDDCRFRMLKPREHLRAQRFPELYVVTGNQGEQTMQAGNAVSANVAHWLGSAVAAVLS